MKRQTKTTKTTGELINRIEQALAIAIMNGDRAIEAELAKALEAAINGTQMPQFLA